MTSQLLQITSVAETRCDSACRTGSCSYSCTALKRRECSAHVSGVEFCADCTDCFAWRFGTECSQCALLLRHQYRGAFIFHEERHEFRRFRLARVPTNHVNTIWTFIEGLARGQGDFLAAPHLHRDRSHKDIDKRVCVVAMDRIRAARRIPHGDHYAFLTGKSVRSFDMSVVTLASLVSSGIDTRHASIKIIFVIVISKLFSQWDH